MSINWIRIRTEEMNLNWISLEKERPKVGTDVLTIKPCGGEEYIYAVGYLDSEGNWRRLGSDYLYRHVPEFWTPLNPPPTGK